LRLRDGATTRAKFESEALRLFAQKGVEGTTIRDLAQAVGVADAALYRYFGSKEAIAAELFQFHYGVLAARVAVATDTRSLPKVEQ
jgi:AcrR family transcriptional regulator